MKFKEENAYLWQHEERRDTGFNITRCGGDSQHNLIIGRTFMPEDAAFIVKTCNNHLPLVKALESTLKELWDDRHSHCTEGTFESYFFNEINALVKAGGKRSW